MSGERNVPVKLHSDLGASVAARWMACPGSIRLSQGLAPDNKSIYAQEGTRAHSLAELSITKNVDPDTFVGVELEGGMVDEDMADFVAVYVDRVKELRQQCSKFWTEHRFNLAALHPPGPMYGTADHVGYDGVNRTLFVDDLKYGAGVVVEVTGNKQTRYYALGAALSLDPKEFPIEKVVMTIVQPRAGHADGPIRSEEISYIALIEFAAELMESARATMVADAPLHAGSHCRFCPASGICPEQRDHALAIVQDEFATDFTPPAPETIPLAQFADMLSKIHVLEDWASAMRTTALGRLERGEEVPGFKLVAKRANRQWTDTSTAEDLLLSDGYKMNEICKPRELKSPAQIEKMTGKKAFVDMMGSVVKKESSGYKMAPASDPAPAIQLLTVGEEFAALPSATPEEE